jgi:hypothetical protein
MAMDQYLLIPFLVGYSHPFTSYFDVHQGYQGFDTLPHGSIGLQFSPVVIPSSTAILRHPGRFFFHAQGQVGANLGIQEPEDVAHHTS